jgi:CubicO group peptidase (beta-lactamase class C family)
MSHDRLPLCTTMSRRSWIGGSAALLLGGCAGAPVSAGRAAPSAVRSGGDEDVARLMRLASVPGMSVASIDGGRTELRGYGVRRTGTADAVTEDTVFEAASLSKPVFAYLVMELEREGVIDLDRPVGEYLALPNAGDARARTLTARHLLSHSGGWRNWRFAPDHVLTAEFEPARASATPERDTPSCRAWWRRWRGSRGPRSSVSVSLRRWGCRAARGFGTL